MCGGGGGGGAGAGAGAGTATDALMFESEREIEGRGGVFGSWLTTGTERRVLPFDVRCFLHAYKWLWSLRNLLYR